MSANTVNTIPDGCVLTDRELVLLILADPRRRIAVELLATEMNIAMQRGENLMHYELTVHGRRIVIIPRGRMREVMLQKEPA